MQEWLCQLSACFISKIHNRFQCSLLWWVSTESCEFNFCWADVSFICRRLKLNLQIKKKMKLLVPVIREAGVEVSDDKGIRCIHVSSTECRATLEHKCS
jgi:hypothetical protein